MTTDDKFFAWLDGELEPAEGAEMEARIASDPELARLAEQHRAFAGELKAAFDPITELPIPQSLQMSLARTADVIDFDKVRRRRKISAVPQWTALAATLAVGVFVGTMVPQRSSGPVRVQSGRMYAAATLNQALDTQLASVPSGEVRIGMTFRSHAGQVCRTFSQSAASGLACRAGDRWQIQGLFGAPEGQTSDYRMAGGMDPNLAALVDSTISGEAFDAAQEKAEREGGWR